MKLKKRQAREILAMYLGWDTTELRDCQYQYGRYSRPVYVVGNDYFCVVRGSGKPARLLREMDGEQFPWEEVKDAFANAEGCKIYKAITVVPTTAYLTR